MIQNYVGSTLFGSGCLGCTIDVYNDLAGEGQAYVGTTTANGVGAWTLVGATHQFGDFTAVATRPINGEHESTQFSTPFAAPFNQDGDAMFDAIDPCPFAAEDYDAYLGRRRLPGRGQRRDGVCDPGLTAVSCTGSDSGKYCFDPAADAGLPECGLPERRGGRRRVQGRRRLPGARQRQRRVRRPCRRLPGERTSRRDGRHAWLAAGPEPQRHPGQPPEALFTTDDVASSGSRTTTACWTRTAATTAPVRTLTRWVHRR